MQTFDLDISVKRVIPLLYVKQRDVGTKILVNITDNGLAYTVPANASFSVWYSGTSGEGNYTAIGDKSAFAVKGNTVIVELIMQMLNNPGGGKMCLVLNGTDGSQLGLWDIPYFVEAIPGADSEEAMQYYTAFLETVTSVENAARRAEEAAEKLEGGLVLKKGEGLNSIVQALDHLTEEDIRKGKPPRANAEGSTVFGEYSVIYDDNDEAGNGETSMAVNYDNHIWGKRDFAANVGNKLFGKFCAGFGHGNWIGEGPTTDEEKKQGKKTISPEAAAVFGTNNHVRGDNAIGSGNLTHANAKNSMTGGLQTRADAEQGVALGENTRNYGRNSLTGGYDSQTGLENKTLKVDSVLGAYTNFSQKGIPATAGETYVISYDYKLNLSQRGSETIVARLQFRDSAGTKIGSDHDFKADKVLVQDWKNLSAEITAPEGTATIDLIFWIWIDNAGECWIDNVSLHHVTEANGQHESEELITNGDFEKYLTGWAKGTSPETISIFGSGKDSIAWGCGVKATEEGTAAFGRYNDPNTGALLSVGNGTDDDNRSNAFEVRDNSVVVNGQEMTRENIASLLAHLPNKENPHGVTVAQLGIPELHACYLTIDAGKSVRFRIEGSSIVFGRVNGAGSSCAAYVVAGYSHKRAPLITQLAAGTQITLSTGGNDNDLWYVELSNTNAGSVSIGVYIMGQGVPTFI